jgi:hypothetical protein
MIKTISKRARKKRAKQEADAIRFAGVDLCSCGHRLKCEGICRQTHETVDGVVQCCAVWQLEPPTPKRNKKRKKIPRKTNLQANNQNKDRARDRRDRKLAYS